MRMESEELSAETASTDACASGSLAPRSLEGSKLAGERTVRDPKKSHQLCLLPARLHDGCRQQTDRGDVEGRCREVNDHEHELSTLRHASQVTCTDESTVYNGREAEGGTLATSLKSCLKNMSGMDDSGGIRERRVPNVTVAHHNHTVGSYYNRNCICDWQNRLLLFTESWTS